MMNLMIAFKNLIKRAKGLEKPYKGFEETLYYKR